MQKSSKPTQTNASDWPVTAGLLALTAIPFLAGIVRLIGLSSGLEPTPDNARFIAAPVPVIMHIISATLFCVVGAFQFAPAFRRRRPGWHRVAGRVLMVCGVVSGLSGMWMTQFYPLPNALQGNLLYAFRLVIGALMVLSIARSWVAIVRRDVPRHRAWMLRAYAIGQAAGTQALIFLPVTVLFGEVLGVPRDLLMILAWIINLAVVEWVIRKRPATRGRAASGVGASASVAARP